MSKHLYNSTLHKFFWFAKRFGVAEMWRKPLRVMFAPMIIPRLPAKEFEFKGKKLPCFYHAYNMTWATERCVEVPVARSYLDACPGENRLEVGNVLSHYSVCQHEILDKFEKGPGVINEDIVTFNPQKKYSLIISISTFEHIGFDDESSSSSADKILEAIACCRRLLAPKGLLMITVPIQYNPELDGLIREGKLGAAREFYLKRTGKLKWEPVDRANALPCRFGAPFPYANAVLFAEFSALD